MSSLAMSSLWFCWIACAVGAEAIHEGPHIQVALSASQTRLITFARVLSEADGNYTNGTGGSSSTGWQPGWRTWSAFGACSICAAVAALSVYISFLPASIISIDGQGGAAAINLQPNLTINAASQAVMGRQQGEVAKVRANARP